MPERLGHTNANIHPDILGVGTLLCGGKYRIGRHIASGGFGHTYEAVNVQLNTTCAVKEFFTVSAMLKMRSCSQGSRISSGKRRSAFLPSTMSMWSGSSTFSTTITPFITSWTSSRGKHWKNSLSKQKCRFLKIRPLIFSIRCFTHWMWFTKRNSGTWTSSRQTSLWTATENALSSISVLASRQIRRTEPTPRRP